MMVVPYASQKLLEGGEGVGVCAWAIPMKRSSKMLIRTHNVTVFRIFCLLQGLRLLLSLLAAPCPELRSLDTSFDRSFDTSKNAAQGLPHRAGLFYIRPFHPVKQDGSGQERAVIVFSLYGTGRRSVNLRLFPAVQVKAWKHPHTETRCCRSDCLDCSCCGWQSARCPDCCSTSRPAAYPTRPYTRATTRATLKCLLSILSHRLTTPRLLFSPRT